MEPQCALFSGNRAIVSIVEGRQFRKDFRHARRRDEGKQGLHEVAVRERRKVWRVESVSVGTDAGALAEGATNELSQTWRIPLAGHRIRDDQ